MQTEQPPTGRPEGASVERWAALGGVIGPAAFIGAWNLGAMTTDRDYAPMDDAISRLAAVGADSRPLMTAGFLVFGTAVPVYAWSLRHHLEGWAWTTATATGLATLLVAATPLDRSATVDTWHGVFAGLGYVTLAATPLLAAGPLRRAGHPRLARYGLLVGAVSALSLALTTTSLPNGLFQRLGLTATDTWLIASAALLAAGRIDRDTDEAAVRD